MDPRQLRMVSRLMNPQSASTAMGDWYRIENKQSTTEVYIYDVIGDFGVTADQFVQELNKIKTGTITLRINTPGGQVFDGSTIYHALKDHPAKVNVIIDGVAASAGSFIAMAGDTIQMQTSAMLMIHEGHTGQFGSADDLRKTADLLDKISENIADIYAKRSKSKDKGYFRTKMKDETWYNAEEALNEGLVDEVLGSDSEPKNELEITITNEKKSAEHEQASKPLDEASDADFELDIEGMLRALKEAL
jgi:ATP-dependent protease ClpP protease subunit